MCSLGICRVPQPVSPHADPTAGYCSQLVCGPVNTRSTGRCPRMCLCHNDLCSRMPCSRLIWAYGWTAGDLVSFHSIVRIWRFDVSNKQVAPQWQRQLLAEPAAATEDPRVVLRALFDPHVRAAPLCAASAGVAAVSAPAAGPAAGRARRAADAARGRGASLAGIRHAARTGNSERSSAGALPPRSATSSCWLSVDD